jgi:hypothetical protein
MALIKLTPFLDVIWKQKYNHHARLANNEHAPVATAVSHLNLRLRRNLTTQIRDKKRVYGRFLVYRLSDSRGGGEFTYW